MKKLILFFIVVFGITIGSAQVDPNNIENLKEVAFCKSDAALEWVNYKTRKMPGLIKILSNPSARISCGRIRVTFLDETRSPSVGFADPTLGPARRNAVCEVMNYVQSVINFPASITPATPLDIIFDSTNLPSSPTLGQSTFSYPNSFPGTPGYYGGFVYDYITSGNDPALTVGPAGIMEHGRITMNFGHSYSYASSSPSSCDYDFKSIILHEFTHLLGVASFMTENTSTQLLESAAAPNVFSQFDQRFLWYYNDSNILLKMVDRISFSANGGINPDIPADIFNGVRRDRVWLNNNLLTTKTNQPINSSQGFIGGTTLSHLDQNYNTRTYQSPGFSPNYVMNGFIIPGVLKYGYTKEEFRLLQILGYTINTSTVSNLTNSPPSIDGNVIRQYGEPGPGGIPFPEEQPSPAGNNNLSITTTNCQPVIINLGSNTITAGSLSHSLGITDLDLDPISVFNGQLINLRGCGNSIGNIDGNNNSQLTINSPNNNSITFIPRKNFTGRAQFAFHLFDGKDRGAYVVITIDVTADTCFKNGDAGIEHVINGSFEEGTLVNTSSAPNNLIVENIDMSYAYTCPFMFQAANFTDGQQYRAWSWQDPYVRGSALGCGAMESYQSPKNGTGFRYVHFSNEPYHQRLEPSLSCNNYRYSVDVVFGKDVPINTSTVLNLTLRNTINGTDLFTIPLTVEKTSASGTEDVWHTFTGSINYNNILPARFLFLNSSAFTLLVDNISIVDDLDNPYVPATMTSASTETICTYGTVNISLTSNIPSTYTWVASENSNVTGESTVVQTSSAINDTIINNSGAVQTVLYTVTPTTTGGCIGTPQTVTITVNPTCPDGCPPNLVFSALEQATTATVYRAANTIITQTNYVNNTNLTIEMLAGDSVDLLNGTDIRINSDFLADIENCDGTGRHSDTAQQTTAVSQEPSKTPTTETEKITIFPNPNKGNFTVQFNSVSTKEVHILVNDMSGRTIFDKKYNNTGVFSQNLQLDNIQAGIYLVTVQNGERKEVKRIIVE